jgi:hypothetical protein
MKTRYLLLLMTGLVALSPVVSAVTFTDTFAGVEPLFRTNQAAIAGITFTPAKAAIDPPETEVPQTVYLLDWTFAKSSSGYGGTSSQTYLAVLSYDAQRGYADVLGVSSNFVNMAETSVTYPDSLMTWEFDYLPLDKDTEYALLFVSYNEAGELVLTGGGIELEVSTAYPYGGAIQSGRTTVNQPNWNAHFIATYSTVTPYVSAPEPANGAENVPIDIALSWTGPNAYSAIRYDVYLDPNEVRVAEGDPSVLLASTDQTSVPVSLLNSTTYYWRVDVFEPNEPMPIVHTGPVWRFTTAPAEVVITQHPAGQTVQAGQTAEFTMQAVNAETYQWYKDGIALDGQTAPTLVIEDVRIADEGFYYCVADNSLNIPAATNAVQLLTERLVGWWKLDGDLNDAVTEVYPEAVAHHGAAFDPNFADGIDGLALEMYGSPQDIVTMTDSAEFYNFYPRGYTVSAWVQTETTGPWGAYVSKQGQDPARGFILTRNAAGNAVHTLRQSFGDLGSGVFIADGSWHFVTGTYDAATGTGRVYVNGVLSNQATSTGVPQPSPASLIFGAELPDGSVPHIGLLDDVRIWSYPLDAYAVARLYVEVKPDEEICLGYPEFDIAGPDGIGQQFRDCRVDLYDFAAFSQSWLECNIVPTCLP